MPYTSPLPQPPRARQRWLILSLAAVQLLVVSSSFVVMSSARLITNADGLWSRSLPAALVDLHRYAATGSAHDYQEFQQSLAAPLGFSTARNLLEAGNRNSLALRRSLQQGLGQAQDAHRLSYLLSSIWGLTSLAATQAMWQQGDAYLQQTQHLAQAIAERRQSNKSVPVADIEVWQQQITQISRNAAPLAAQFNASLDKHLRQLAQLILLVNLCTALLLYFVYWMTLRKATRRSAAAILQLAAERQHHSNTLDTLADGVITLDANQRIRAVNPAAAYLLGVPSEQLLGCPIAEVLSFAPDQIASYKAALAADELPSTRESEVHWLHRSDTESVAVQTSISLLEHNGVHTSTVVVLHDVSQEQQYINLLAWQASHDALTGLKNRTAFETLLEQAIGTQQASLLQLNLDHFKMINVTYGHAVGDEVLRQVCQLLRHTLRENDVLARIGGDEFAVLLTHCKPHAAMQTAERLRQSVHELNVHWHQKNLHTGVSIGVVHIDVHHQSDAQSLLGMADNACKHAKETGRNRIIVYDPFNRIFQRYQGDMEWVQRLRSSLENNLFTLMAQTVYPLKPQANDQGGVHFEVLLRLQDGQGQLIAPSVFIPIAERYDLMPHIDRWVVRNALKLLRSHLTAGANINTCSINLSGASLGDNELLEFIRHNIFEHGISAEKLCFEITETSAIASMENATSMITELRKLGCRFSLDDFGSGMASFRYLQQLPVDYLKIDGSFVQDMMKNPSNHAMVEAIHHIGHVLGKKTVAEFVGDAATFEDLKIIGVDFAQGYYIAPPVPLNAEFFSRASLPPPQITSTHSSPLSAPRYS